MLGSNQDVIINQLLAKHVISHSARRGHYFVCDDHSTRTYVRNQILERFTTHPVAPLTGIILEDRYILNQLEIASALSGTPAAPQPAPEVRPMRTIDRLSYHGATRDYAPYISRVAPDSDGVVRTFGLEYEIYSLTFQQESDLAYLLDTLPAHVTERDGSLTSSGVEIVFMPMDAQSYIRTVKVLAQFVRDNGIRMGQSNGDGAGMHTTYGVSNAEATKEDLQIRLNRYAFALAALGTKPRIQQIFGRTFGYYRSLPTSTTTMDHSNAFSCNGRPKTCWECRLPNWQADPEALVKFFRITETAFHRPFNTGDLVALGQLLDVVPEGC